MRARLQVSTLLLLSVLGAPAVAGAAKYAITDVSGGRDSAAYAINKQGQVVGRFRVADNVGHAFLSSAGSFVDIGTFGGVQSTALGINAAGKVVGSADSLEGTNAYLYTGGVLSNLGTFTGTGNAGAAGINDAGQIVGYSINSARQRSAFLYESGKFKDLGALGGDVSSANAINNRGQVVGNAAIAPGNVLLTHAFLYSDGTMSDLGTLGGSTSNALAINNAGQVVGYAAPAGDTTDHAFLYSAGVLTDLGTLGGSYSFALGINNQGDVVGYSGTDANGTQHGYLYGLGQMTDLNSLIDPSLGWRIVAANGINDSQQIAATACMGELCHAVRLDPLPVPEPASGSLLAAGLGLLAVLRRARRPAVQPTAAASLRGPSVPGA